MINIIATGTERVKLKFVFCNCIVSTTYLLNTKKEVLMTIIINNSLAETYNNEAKTGETTFIDIIFQNSKIQKIRTSTKNKNFMETSYLGFKFKRLNHSSNCSHQF